MTAANPLLDFTDLPRFDAIRPEHVAPAIDTLLQQAETALQQVTAPDFPADWTAMAQVLDVATERLARAWGVVSHLNSVADTPELRAAYNEALPRVTAFWTRLGADERLYAKYKAMDAATLNPEQRQAREHALRNFVLGGAELTGAAKERFAQIQERLAELSQKFSENVLDATDRWAYYASADELDGVPTDVQQAARAAAQAEGREGYKLTLKMPCYLPVLQFAHSGALRQRLYRAYVTRASDQAEGEDRQFDNTAIIREILALRQQEARLLGYRNYAEVSLVPKMAESPAQVKGFLADLATRARPYAERDLQELRRFAADELGLTELKPWDNAFASERLKQARYAFSDNEVKQYFTEPKVLDGLFRIIETVFEVQIRPDTAPVWHEHVRFFRVERDGALLAQFYLDPYARQGKQGGAWMDDVRVRWARPEGTLQTPVAHLVCNFPSPQPGRPALLTHDDVITLFHEFGHGLHLMLTQVADIGVSGLSGVEWDAVELPSQFMENFTWEWEVLQRLTAHVDTGEPLPRALFDKMIAAKNFQSGLQTMRQIEFSLFDMRLHAEPGKLSPQGDDLRRLPPEGAREPAWDGPALGPA
ncbi:MAG: M3 family metallopeptidase, partial [Hylemonella sp.]